MNHRIVMGGLLLATALGGCTNVPTPDFLTAPKSEPPSFTVDDLIGHIQCELRRSLTPELITNGYVAQVTLTLKVEDNGALSPSLSFINALGKTSSVAYGAGANVNVDRQRTFTSTYTIDLTRFNQNPRYDKAEPATDCESHGIYSLSGDLGIRGIIEAGKAVGSYKGINTPASTTGGSSTEAPKATAEPQPLQPGSGGGSTAPVVVAPAPSGPAPTAPTFGSTVQFALAGSANFTPSWSFVRFKGPNGTLSSVSHTNTDTLQIVFSPSNSTASAAALAEEAAALAALNAAQQRFEAARAKRDAAVSRLPLMATAPGGKRHKATPTEVTAQHNVASATSDVNAASADIAKWQKAYDEAHAARQAGDTQAKAQAAVNAQNFTTNMILQNLAGSLSVP